MTQKSKMYIVLIGSKVKAEKQCVCQSFLESMYSQHNIGDQASAHKPITSVTLGKLSLMMKVNYEMCLS